MIQVMVQSPRPARRPAATSDGRTVYIAVTVCTSDECDERSHMPCASLPPNACLHPLLAAAVTAHTDDWPRKCTNTDLCMTAFVSHHKREM